MSAESNITVEPVAAPGFVARIEGHPLGIGPNRQAAVMALLREMFGDWGQEEAGQCQAPPSGENQ